MNPIEMMRKYLEKELEYTKSRNKLAIDNDIEHMIIRSEGQIAIINDALCQLSTIEEACQPLENDKNRCDS